MKMEVKKKTILGQPVVQETVVKKPPPGANRPTIEVTTKLPKSENQHDDGGE